MAGARLTLSLFSPRKAFLPYSVSPSFDLAPTKSASLDWRVDSLLPEDERVSSCGRNHGRTRLAIKSA